MVQSRLGFNLQLRGFKKQYKGTMRTKRREGGKEKRIEIFEDQTNGFLLLRQRLLRATLLPVSVMY